jgi:outer membrane protein TolC
MTTRKPQPSPSSPNSHGTSTTLSCNLQYPIFNPQFSINFASKPTAALHKPKPDSLLRFFISVIRHHLNWFQISASLGLFCVAATFFAGCTSFQPKPLSPDKTAEQLESRSLTNLALKSFLETNLHQSFPDWPVATWNFDQLTLVAFYYHPSLEVARADWRVATAGEETAAERPNPTVTASGIYEPAADAFSPWIPGVVFDIPIETAGKRRYRTAQAEHLSESARFNLATTAWQVRSKLRSALVDFATARQRLELLQSQLKTREELNSRLEKQLQAGAISPFELNVARLALVRARADFADAQRVLAEARAALADSLGLPAKAVEHLDVRFDIAPPETAEAMTTTDARDLALRGRADILAALSDYAASQSALQLAVAGQYPDLHLSPGYSWNGGSTGEHDWQLGVTLELPILNHHHGAVSEAAAKCEASAARFLELQSKIINQIDSAIASFRASQTNVAAMNTLLDTQNHQQHSIEEQFQAGALDRLDVLNAELELNATSLALLDAQIKLQQSVGALEDAVQRPFELPKAIFQTSKTDAY